MASCRLPLGLLLLALGACTPPGSLTDGLDAPSGPRPPSALPDQMFPNAPSGGDWVTVGALNWETGVPLRQDPIYEPGNASGVVDYGDDDPNAVWGRQTSIVSDGELPSAAQAALEFRMPRGLTGGYAASKVGQHPDNDGNGPLRWDPALNTGHLYIGFYVKFSPELQPERQHRPEGALPEERSRGEPSDRAHGRHHGERRQPRQPAVDRRMRRSTRSAAIRSPCTAANDMNDGRWHLVELLQGPNTPGVEQRHAAAVGGWPARRAAGPTRASSMPGRAVRSTGWRSIRSMAVARIPYRRTSGSASARSSYARAEATPRDLGAMRSTDRFRCVVGGRDHEHPHPDLADPAARMRGRLPRRRAVLLRSLTSLALYSTIVAVLLRPVDADVHAVGAVPERADRRRLADGDRAAVGRSRRCRSGRPDLRAGQRVAPASTYGFTRTLTAPDRRWSPILVAPAHAGRALEFRLPKGINGGVPREDRRSSPSTAARGRCAGTRR